MITILRFVVSILCRIIDVASSVERRRPLLLSSLLILQEMLKRRLIRVLETLFLFMQSIVKFIQWILANLMFYPFMYATVMKLDWYNP